MYGNKGVKMKNILDWFDEKLSYYEMKIEYSRTIGEKWKWIAKELQLLTIPLVLFTSIIWGIGWLLIHQ